MPCDLAVVNGRRLWDWDSLPMQNFVKKSLRGIGPIGAHLYQK